MSCGKTEWFFPGFLLQPYGDLIYFAQEISITKIMVMRKHELWAE